MSSCIIGYAITNANGATVSSLIKINVNLTYAFPTAFIFSDGSTTIRRFDFSTVTTATVYTTANIAAELASNQNDALFYYYSSATGNIHARDI